MTKIEDSSAMDAERLLRHAFLKSWGAQMLPDGRCRFRLWAPGQEKLTLRLENHDVLMAPQDDGWFEVVVAQASPGDRYCFVLGDGLAVPDPAARAQARDQHGPSLVVDAEAYAWQDRAWRGRPWHETVIYELHIGTFTPEGTFRAAAERLAALADLGVTIVELMPVAHFPGSRNWGYDGVFLYAPHKDYGSPDDLKSFVETAHALGVSVILDVVYNHFGPDGNYLAAYAPEFFHEDRHTPWGAAIDYRHRAVRDFFIENALYWLEEYQLDGLRFDAIDNIHDDASDVHLLVELAERVRAAFPDRHIHLTTEDVRNITSLHGRDENGRAMLYDAEWNDDFHHVAHVIATGEGNGHYANYVDAPFGKLARALAEGYVYQGEPRPTDNGKCVGEPSAHLPPTAFINFIQNHDQIGNRAFGERLSVLATPDMVECLTAILLLSPQIPLLYMGEEYGESAPFYFFADLHGSLGESIRKGRREEAERFGGFAGGKTHEHIPDPLSPLTSDHSVLDWSGRETASGAARLDLVRHLLALRRQHIMPLLADANGNAGTVLTAQEGCVAVDWMLGRQRLQLRANLGGEQQPMPPVSGAVLFASREDALDLLQQRQRLEPMTVLVALQ